MRREKKRSIDTKYRNCRRDYLHVAKKGKSRQRNRISFNSNIKQQLFYKELISTLYKITETDISSSSSLCCTASTDLSDPLSPPSLSSIAPGRSSRLYPVSALSCCIYILAGRPAFARPCKGCPQEYIAYESVLISPAVSRMSGSSNFDSFRDGW